MGDILGLLLATPWCCWGKYGITNPKQPIIIFKSGAFMLSCVSKEFHLVWFWCRVVSVDIFSLSFIHKA